MRLLTVCVCVALSFQANAQRGFNFKDKGDTITTNYALVVGISNYESPNIRPLLYADDDAYLFSDYLLNQQICVRKNIVRLIDSMATIGNFYKELKRLITNAEKNSRVFIYFAGHGDVENEIDAGYLLPYNTEATNYSASAIDIDKLEKYINKFVENNVKVVLITDACRSGNLVGGVAGASATIKSLASRFKNVMKLLSCQPNELSEERPFAEGGHGVFTYHLVDGLNGMADRNQDTAITLMELRTYLDIVSVETGEKQIPIVDGDLKSRIAGYDHELKRAAMAKKTSPPVAKVNKKKVERAVTEDTLWNSNKYFTDFHHHLRNLRFTEPQGQNAWHILQLAQINKQPAALVEDMKLELAAVLEDEAQKWINKYLRADLESNDELVFKELGKNQAYLEVVAELIGKNDPRIDEIKAKQVFFQSYLIWKKNEKEKFRDGIEQLANADSSTPNQAWILHAQALLYGSLRDHSKAIEFDKQALRLAPKWAYALNNLAVSYQLTGQIPEAEITYKKAIAIDSTDTYAWNNLGTVYSEQENYTEAEKMYLKAISLDSTLAEPWRNLSVHYYNQERYRASDLAYQKAVSLGIISKDPRIDLAQEKRFNTEMRSRPLTDFEKEKGKLPWPIDSGFVSMPYGRYTLPGTELQYDNPGLTFSTPAGAAVKAIFDGAVIAIFDIDDTKAVLIRHDKYFTTYSNLSMAKAKKGAEVRKGEIIGYSGIDAIDNERGQVDLMIMRETTNLNPQAWLEKR